MQQVSEVQEKGRSEIFSRWKDLVPRQATKISFCANRSSKQFQGGGSMVVCPTQVFFQSVACLLAEPLRRSPDRKKTLQRSSIYLTLGRSNVQDHPSQNKITASTGGMLWGSLWGARGFMFIPGRFIVRFHCFTAPAGYRSNATDKRPDLVSKKGGWLCMVCTSRSH